jgi:hypothetical protein
MRRRVPDDARGGDDDATFAAMAARRRLTFKPRLGRAVALTVLLATPALASPRTDPTVGRAVFTGAATPHATSLSLNPAALGLGTFDAVYIALTGTIDQLHMELSPFNQGGLSAPGASVHDAEVSPGGQVAFIYHLAGDRGTIGVEARTNPRESFVEGHPETGFHSLGGGQRDWLVTGGASLKLINALYVGASLSHQNTFFRLKYDRDSALAATDPARGTDSLCGQSACGLANPLATEVYNVDVRSKFLSTDNLKVNIGLVAQIARDVWLGAAYHTPPGLGIQTELAGHVDVTRAPRDGDPTVIRGQSVVEIQFPASVDAELRARLPGELDLHVGGRWEDLSRLNEYDVRAFGISLSQYNIPEWTVRPLGMHDAYALWGGVEQVDVGQRWLFGARLGFETAAVSDDRTSPLTISPQSYTIDLGAQWRISHVLVAQLSYGLQYFPTVTSRNSEYDPTNQKACADSHFDYGSPACEAVREGYAIPPADGTYQRFQHAMRLGLRYEIQ